MTRPVPAWLTSAADQRLALVEQYVSALVPRDRPTIIMTPIKEPAEGSTPAQLLVWERTCDACGADCTHSNFWTGQHQTETKAGLPVIMTFGVCALHKEGLGG